jgi:hypothetical protein
MLLARGRASMGRRPRATAVARRARIGGQRRSRRACRAAAQSVAALHRQSTRALPAAPRTRASAAGARAISAAWSWQALRRRRAAAGGERRSWDLRRRRLAAAAAGGLNAPRSVPARSEHQLARAAAGRGALSRSDRRCVRVAAPEARCRRPSERSAAGSRAIARRRPGTSARHCCILCGLCWALCLPGGTRRAARLCAAC